ncbi:hypothetical protein UFOVP855_32 [uncultured Caudovirales phage]|uniref:Uncharacterized protein n=1 Tax=uncultured Caudovirales phage TaxID=2100421 RepID=A0A6J5Q653_9CAUD|nr:hypothetical protein UFOVP527_9 [uncultured Caudovirales phage]CAB4167605.1 hypothetical protein UFOVP855_32 [uncultured Caudovirales phage]CAB4173601.1 hypothetical protein UFOVP954_42 [uncultured Caudovirales phage]CAB4178982.1 hypothetical protein UFOVP1026_19 [uncultured Caudovirales phage]CAB4188240.1 hypothetical protein UFOVP1180_3 [uncultured Caudovirales phage]
MAKEEQNMINYNKLKLAHEIAIKLDERCSIEVAFFRYGAPRYIFNAPNHNDSFSANAADVFLETLQKLTQPKPKYEIGHEIWMTNICGFLLEIYSAHITGYRFNNGQNEYTIDSCPNDFYILESELHPTREDLIDAQIKYWESLKPTTNYQQPTN